MTFRYSSMRNSARSTSWHSTQQKVVESATSRVAGNRTGCDPVATAALPAKQGDASPLDDRLNARLVY
jgi:hypothetical protein